MIGNRKWQVSSTQANRNGLKTTVTVLTDDETVVRKILQEPTAEKAKDNNSKKEKSMTAEFTTPRRESRAQTKKPLASNSKSVKKELPKLNRKTKVNLAPLKKESTKLLPSPKKNEVVKKSKKKLSKTAVTGNAKIEHHTRNLNENQLQMSDHNSFNGNRGKRLKKEYEEKRKIIEFSGLSNSQKKRLLDKLYKLYSEIAYYDSHFYSPMVSGRARYPVKKMQSLAEKAMNTRASASDWWDSVLPQIESSTLSKKQVMEQQKNQNSSEIDRIKERFYYHYNQAKLDIPEYEQKGKDMRYNYDVRLASNYVDDAFKVDVALYKELFEKLDEIANYNKNTNFYKTYLSVKNGEITQEKLQKQKDEDNKIIYSCSDYIIRNIRIQAGLRVGIKFTFRPKPQLVYALKSRKYVWYLNERMWICKPEKFDLEWAKNISKNYEKYL